MILFASSFDPKLDPADPQAGAGQEEQPRLFDEHNDEDDDAFGYKRFGGKNDGLRVVLVAPDRSPAVPAAITKFCSKAASAETGEEGATDGRADGVVGAQPNPVLMGGWAGAGGGRHLRFRGRSGEEAEEGPKLEAAAANGDEEVPSSRGSSGTEVRGRVRGSGGGCGTAGVCWG